MLFDKYTEQRSNVVPDVGREQLVRTEEEKTTHKGHKKKILECLTRNRERWVLSSELTLITHRFSATILTLRQDGHVIDKRRCDSGFGFEWKYLHQVEMVRIDDDWKSLYYKSPHWKKTREARLGHDNWTCCNCKTPDRLQVHHWRYDLFNERLRDLMTLCEECHARIHDSVTIAFPKSITKAHLQLLGG